MRCTSGATASNITLGPPPPLFSPTNPLHPSNRNVEHKRTKIGYRIPQTWSTAGCARQDCPYTMVVDPLATVTLPSS